MNIFGKNKTLSPGFPTPPQRPEKQQQVPQRSGPEEEEEEEEEDDDQHTYEVPPNEAQSKRIAAPYQQEGVETTYIDLPALRRFSEPNNFLPPKPSMFQLKCGADEDNQEDPFNFQALERALRKGMVAGSLPPALPLSARRVSLPVILASGSQANASKGRAAPFLPLKDDKAAKSPLSTEEEPCREPIYLECEPSTASLPSRVLPCPLPTPPAVPSNPPKTRISPPGAQKYSDMENKPWYAGSCDRQTAEATLLRFNKDSAYLVRQSSRHSWKQPFTLAVLYKNHVYNIPIRYLEGTCQYILGKDGKAHEELFDSIPSIIQNYTERPLVLIDGNTSAKEQTYLLFPVKP